MSTHHPHLKSGGLGSVFKSLTKSLKPSRSVAVTINPTIVGGNDELQKLIQHLRSGSPTSRASTALSVADSIEKYLISSIPEIWYLGRDLLDSGNPSHVRKAGIQLMLKCVAHSDSAIGNRLLYFKDILTYCKLTPKLDAEYDLFLSVLIQLTSNGEDIHDFCIYDENLSLDIFILQSLSTLEFDFQSTSTLTLFTFINNCLTYNFNSLNNDITLVIISHILVIGQKTLDLDITTSIVKMMTLILLLGSVPIGKYVNSIDYLCAIYGLNMSKEINTLISDLFVDLYAENQSSILINSFIQILTNPELLKFKSISISTLGLSTAPINSNIGAIQLILRLQVLNSTKDLNSGCFQSSIIHAFQDVLSLNIPLINTAYLRSFDHLLTKDAYHENFDIDKNEIIEKVLPFYLWYSSFSLFDVFKNLKINNNQDSNYLQSIFNGLQNLYEIYELDAPKAKLVQLFIKNHNHLTSDNISFVLLYYSEEKLCTTLNPLWKDNSILLLNYFYYHSEDVEVQLNCLRVLVEAFEISFVVSQDVDYDLMLDILRKSKSEKDPILVDFLIENVFTYISIHFPSKVFQRLCEVFISDFQADEVSLQKASLRLGSYRSFSGVSTAHSSLKTKHRFSSIFLNTFSKALAKIFILTSAKEADKAKECYELMIILYEDALEKRNVDVLLTLSKCLVRLRATTENYIYLSDPSDMTGLAGSFKRNTQDLEYVPQSSYKWIYPDSIPYLPDKFFNIPSKRLILYNSDNQYENDTSKDAIDISRWFKNVITIMEQFVDWEVYSFIWAHFCSQLTNMQLFQYDQDHIVKLKSIVCDQLTNNLPSSVKLPDGIVKADLQQALIRSMSALLGYHNHFLKHDEDQLIRALIFGLDWWEKTAIPCINILNVCCYEIPNSMNKFVAVILTKLQTRVTSAFASTHTLEFLMSLVEVPSIVTNFSIDDFKRVFGIAFKYIQFAHDMNTRKQGDKPEVALLQQFGVDAEVDQSTSTSINDFTPLLSQYVFTLSYRAIASWYLKISLPDRKKITPYLIKNLVSCSQNGSKLDNHTIGFLDFIYRFTYSDLPLNFISQDYDKDDGLKTTRWIMGKTILSMKTNSDNGDSKWSIIRPTGTTQLLIQLREIPPHQNEILQSNFYLLQFFENLSDYKSNPIPIIDDSITDRAFSVLSRMPTLEFHKIGIIYIGPKQTTEEDVMGNKTGSKSYQTFVNNIGELYQLKQSPKVYVGGLDTENDDDGEYTRRWSNKIIQVVFHIVTMMKNSNSNNKKRHIGNNYINIYFDESGHDFNFNLIRSQFNFISIVITPHSISSDDSIIKNGTLEHQFYKVKTIRRSGIPGVISTSHFKLISLENLSRFVRNLAIVTDHFAQIWHNSRYVSIWSQRVNQINTIIEKTKQSYENLNLVTEEETSHKETTTSFLQQLQENLVAADVDLVNYGQVKFDDD